MVRHSHEMNMKVITTPLRTSVGVCHVVKGLPTVRTHAVVPIGITELGKRNIQRTSDRGQRDTSSTGFAHIGRK
eukprot:1257572-Prorocentrum_lima.AAC.1